MTPLEKKNLRLLFFSECPHNVVIGEEVAKSIDFEIPKTWIKKAKSTKFRNEKVFFNLEQCPFGNHQGKVWDDIPVIDLVRYYNYGVLGKSPFGRGTKKVYEIIGLSIRRRKLNLLSSISKRVSTPLRKTKSGYLDESYYSETSL